MTEPPDEVADALELHERDVLDWAAGTDRAYRSGVYVAAPVPGWTLAHGRMHVPAGFDATGQHFPDWLRKLSRRLGEVQFFANERVPDYHAWARALDGELLRAYCFIGERGEVPLFLGDPTADEVELGIGTRGMESGREHWSDEEWTAWYATTPSESDVMAMAGLWSIDPTTIDNATVTTTGIYGNHHRSPAAESRVLSSACPATRIGMPTQRMSRQADSGYVRRSGVFAGLRRGGGREVPKAQGYPLQEPGPGRAGR